MIPTYTPYEAATPTSVPVVTPAAEGERAASANAGSPQNVVRESYEELLGKLPFRNVSRSAVLMTLNQLAVMSRNGIEIAEALETVAQHCHNRRLAESLRRVHEAVNSGKPFSSAIAAFGIYFPRTLAPMIAAAEASGDVPETLSNVCERLRGELQMRGTVLGAMIYPLILIMASSVVMGALVLGVLPQFSRVFESLGRPVPASTQWLLATGDFCRQHWWWMVPLTLGSIILVYLLRRHQMIQRPWNRFLMFGWPIRSAYQPLQAGRMFRTLASMVEGGVPLLQSVRLARHTTRDVYWQYLLDRIEESLIDGSTASGAMAGIDFIPPETAQMMATAERTGRVSEVLDNIGAFYEEEAGRRIKRLVVALEPAIILVMGVIVAAVVMALLLPLLDVTAVGS